MKNLARMVIVLFALVGGIGGYLIGRQTAPAPWLQERKSLLDSRWELAKQVRAMRETVIGYEKSEAAKSLSRLTTTRAVK
jgi:hypothetical protein